MKHIMNVKTLAATLSSIAFLAACGGGSGGSGSSPAPAPGSFTIGGVVTGMSLSGSVKILNNGGDEIAVTKNGEFTFSSKVTGGTAYDVTVQTNPIGQVCIVTNGTGKAAADVANVSINCDNKKAKFGYVSNLNGQNISEYVVDQVSGVLTQTTNSPFAVGVRPTVSVANPNGKYLYIASATTDTPMQTLQIDKASGALSNYITYHETGATSFGIAISPNGKYLYLTTTNNKVTAFSTDSLRIVGSYATGTDPKSVTVDPSGKFVYVLNSGGAYASITAYGIASDTGGLVEIASYNVGGIAPVTNALSVHPNGKYLYVASMKNNKNVQAYAINANTGALSFVTGYGEANSSYSTAIDPNGKYLYVVSNSNVIGYAINSQTGGLSLINSYAAGPGANGVTIDPTGSFVYVANIGANNVSMFSIDKSSGALVSSGNSPAGDYPVYLGLAVNAD